MRTRDSEMQISLVRYPGRFDTAAESLGFAGQQLDRTAFRYLTARLKVTRLKVVRLEEVDASRDFV